MSDWTIRLWDSKPEHIILIASARGLSHFQKECSSLALISFSYSSANTWRLDSGAYFFLPSNDLFSKLIYDRMNNRVLKIVTSRSFSEFCRCCCCCFPFHRTIVYESLFLCVALTWNSDAKSNLNNWPFSTVAWPWFYSRRARNTWVHFTVAVQKFAVLWCGEKLQCAQAVGLSTTLRIKRRATRDDACSLCPSHPSGRRMIKRLSGEVPVFSLCFTKYSTYQECFRQIL
jgi:hypothetical protein